MACVSDNESLREKNTACRRCKHGLIFSVIPLWMIVAYILVHRELFIEKRIDKITNLLNKSSSSFTQGKHLSDLTRLKFADMKGQFMRWTVDIKGNETIAVIADGTQVKFLQDQWIHIRVKVHIDADVANYRNIPRKIGFTISLFKSEDASKRWSEKVAFTRGKMLMGTADDREISEQIQVKRGNTVHLLVKCEQASDIVRSGVMDILQV